MYVVILKWINKISYSFLDHIKCRLVLCKMLLRQEVITCRSLEIIVVSIINKVFKALERMKKVT